MKDDIEQIINKWEMTDKEYLSMLWGLSQFCDYLLDEEVSDEQTIADKLDYFLKNRVIKK